MQKQLDLVVTLPGYVSVLPLPPPHLLCLERDSLVKYDMAANAVLWKQPYVPLGESE